MEKHKQWKQTEGEAHWQSPANIALVKYWGKYPEQLPMNPSLSFVLEKSVIDIHITYTLDAEKPFRLVDFHLNGSTNQGFASRIEKYLTRLSEYFPFLAHAQVRIDSKSTFPHSAGIASSAAAFSAIALCVCTMDNQVHQKKTDLENFFKKASYMARLGSGSACRSLYNGMVVWGETPSVPGSSDEYACRLDTGRIHHRFRSLCDTILIADSKTKKVSSSAGHALMQAHPYRDRRKQQALSNMDKICTALGEGDWQMFGEVVENEALSLHSLMMSSNPGYILMHPNTIIMIDKIRSFRQESNIPVCFTLDAGPNIHMIYPGEEKKRVASFVSSTLSPLCEENRWIDDGMGPGPRDLGEKPV